MRDEGRRDFLKTLALTTVYTAPIVHTLAVPDPAAGQGLSTKGMMMMMAMMMMGGQTPTPGPAPDMSWPPPSTND